MNAIEIFFGPAAHSVLPHYRGIVSGRQAIQSLDEHLQRLRRECRQWQERDAKEIEERELRVRKSNAELTAANEALSRLQQKRERLSESVDAWWKRLGIRLMRIFSGDMPSVKEIRAQVAAITEKLPEAEQRVEQQLKLRRERAEALSELAEPIASHEYAIVFLEDKRESLLQEVSQADQAIMDEFRSTVASMPSHTLLTRLQRLASLERGLDLVDDVLELRSILIELEARPTEDEAIELVLSSGDTLEHVRNSVQEGFRTVDGNGKGTISLKGQGTSHVQKTRTRTETTRDANGRTRTRPRRETYWDKVSVTFSGGVRVDFPVAYTRWSSDTFGQAVMQEAETWFKAGRSRVLRAESSGPVEELRKQADALVRQIRCRIEAVHSA